MVRGCTMIEVTKIVEWDMGHRVPNHKSKCRNLHGHRYRLELTVSGDIDETEGASSEGMVLDFGDVKRVMMERVHDVLDHGFMFYEKDELLDHLFREHAPDGGFNHLAVPFIPTAENIAVWCYRQLRDAFPPGIHIAKVRIYETPNSWADYRPETP